MESEGRKVVRLATSGADQNVNVRISDVARVFPEGLSPRLRDLLHIACYVFAADCSTNRGEGWEDDVTERWDRDLKLVIPVEDPAFWTTPRVRKTLVRTLNFLSDDVYSFEFEKQTSPALVNEYMDFGDSDDWPFYGVDRVVMFSGGLDSLAGAVEACKTQEHVALVSHRSEPKMHRRQQDLVDLLRRKFNANLLHIPVWVNKASRMTAETTQRTRSFLYVALGTIVAQSLKAGGVRFFENGVISLNLPVADEAQRSRASRTTHPYALGRFTDLCSLITEREFIVDNPYFFMTKTEVVETLKRSNASDLIRHTRSCSRTLGFVHGSRWHCGLCSQCIDRRVAIIAAGEELNDPAEDYVCDVFLGPRKNSYEQNIAVDYAALGLSLAKMDEDEIVSKYQLQISRAAGVLGGDVSEAAARIAQMLRRHGQSLERVIHEQIKAHPQEIVDGKIPETSMLRRIIAGEIQRSPWKRYCECAIDYLKRGLPSLCRTRPANEIKFQECCDGILRSHDSDLIREFPYLRWTVVMTKPDWSKALYSLFIEAKYVRKKKDILPITEEIAADITKYGDNGRHCLFLIYDPDHLVDEEEVSRDIEKHEGMMVAFYR